MLEPVVAEDGTPVEYKPDKPTSVWKWIIILVAVVYVAGSLYFAYDMRNKLDRLEHSQDATRSDLGEVGKRLATTQASTETLASQLGITKRDLAERAAELQRQQRAAEARLSAQQKQQMSQVSGEVAGVKTEVGGVKTDLGSTKTDLEATKAKLEHAIGDLGIQSGLIAHTRDDLETLKHKGDRSYYEFSLAKKQRPTPVSTVSLQLKKTDAKKGKFTMNVMADDRTIEKKDRNVNEPIQFYTGRDHMLYEVVVWTVDKEKITGYLSTPKGAPQPAVQQ